MRGSEVVSVLRLDWITDVSSPLCGVFADDEPRFWWIPDLYVLATSQRYRRQGHDNQARNNMLRCEVSFPQCGHRHQNCVACAVFSHISLFLLASTYMQ